MKRRCLALSATCQDDRDSECPVRRANPLELSEHGDDFASTVGDRAVGVDEVHLAMIPSQGPNFS